MEETIDTKNKYRLLLFEPKLLFGYKKDFAAFFVAFNLYKDYCSSVMGAEEIRREINKIRIYDARLALSIENLLGLSNSYGSLFSGLIAALRQGKEYFVSYISTHDKELALRAKSISNNRVSSQLTFLFSSISGREVDYLLSYKNDSGNWGNYSINNRIEFFISRVNLYLRGGNESNNQFKGLLNDFGDKEVTVSILKNKAVMYLWKYNEQIKFLNSLIELCKKSGESGEWKGFFGKQGFWTNIDKYAARLEKEFSNEEFAKTIISKKKEIGESPEGWGGSWNGVNLATPGLLNNLLYKLNHPSFQRKMIIIPASQELRIIFENREAVLKENRDNHIKELIGIITNTGGLKSKKRIAENFRSELIGYSKKSIERLGEDLSRFAKVANEPLLSYEEFMEEFDKYTLKIDPQTLWSSISRLSGIMKSNDSYTADSINNFKFLRSISDLTLVSGADLSAKQALLKIEMLRSFDHLNDEDIKNLESLVPKAEGLLVKLNNLGEYLKSKINESYTLRPEFILNLDFNNIRIRNLNNDLGYVRKVLLRLVKDFRIKEVADQSYFTSSTKDNRIENRGA
ncbi:MAG TPA: hypothetical protein VI564_06170 [Candidatus Nanoarchaeia archaeon]|nr:hypothetical protein [Candidatus Nanoarchaeia archaeon]